MVSSSTANAHAEPLDAAYGQADRMIEAFAVAAQHGQAARLAGPARSAARALRDAAAAGMTWQAVPAEAGSAPAAIRSGTPTMTTAQRQAWEQAVDRFDDAARGLEITAVAAGFEQLAELLDQHAAAQDAPVPSAGAGVR